MSRAKDLGIAVIAIVAIAAIVATVASLVSAKSAKPARPVQGCQVSVDGHSTSLSFEQSENAAMIVGESLRRGLPARAATIALTTAYQESNLINLDHGDLDSIGLFQQRPSQGWGTEEQIMDPWYSAGAFYDRLIQVPDWQTDDISDVAQKIQISNHPDAYRKHEANARAWASALTGFSPASVSCVNQQDNPAAPDKLIAFLNHVWGENLSISQEAETVTVLAGSEPTTWAIAQLSQLLGQQIGLVSASTNGFQWTMSPDAYQRWEPNQSAAAAEGTWQATVTLRAPRKGA